MKISRLEALYEQKWVDPKHTLKNLPLESILKRPLVFYPSEPKPANYSILEIGPGRGDFLFSLCENHPDKSIVAVEYGKPRFEKLVLNAQKRKIQNLTLIYGDARIPVETHFLKDQFEKVYVLFPDPWPKNKHRHKRLLQADFLNKLALKIKSGGEFLLVTDVQDYAKWTLDQLQSIQSLTNLGNDPLPLLGLPNDVIPTFFYEKWKSMGRQFWHVRFKKV